MSPTAANVVVSLAFLSALHGALAMAVPPNVTSMFAPCPSQCRFRFCESVGPSMLPLSLPDTSLTPAVCAHNFARVTLGATGQARIQLPGTGSDMTTGYVAASELRDGMGQSLSLAPSVFKAYVAHQADALGDGSSGIGSETLTDAQKARLDGACVQLPVLQWQITDFPGAQVRNGKMMNPVTDCVAFRVARPRIEARLRWASGGDLDLRVVRPTGETVFHAAARSRDALYVRDGDGACTVAEGGVEKGGVEAIAFVGGPAVTPGVYFVKVHRFRRCVAGDVGFTVELRVDGNTIWSREGVIGGGDADEYEMGWAVNVQL